MEGFDSMMRIATRHTWIRGFHIGDKVGGGKELSHQLYADDTTIMCETEAEQLNYIRLFLILFEAVSGLKVSWGEQSDLCQTFSQDSRTANISGCKI